MKTKSFYELIKTKLSEEQLDEIDRQAQLEADIIKASQKVADTKKIMKKNKHLGPDYDDILREEGKLEEAELTAMKMVIIEQVAKEMKKKKLSQTAMVKCIGISIATFMRLLDPQDYSVTLLTLYRTAAALGKELKIRFIKKEKIGLVISMRGFFYLAKS